MTKQLLHRYSSAFPGIYTRHAHLFSFHQVHSALYFSAHFVLFLRFQLETRSIVCVVDFLPVVQRFSVSRYKIDHSFFKIVLVSPFGKHPAQRTPYAWVRVISIV